MSQRIYLYKAKKALTAYITQDTPRLVERLHLTNIPTPPSSNGAYANVPGKGRVLTRGAVLWKYEMNAWALKNIAPLANLVIMGKEKRPLACECLFYFPRDEVFSKAGDVKPLDAPNFQKLLIDQLCEFGMFDDRMFFRTEAEKVIGPRHVDMNIWFL
jgi:hypothetical protein